jgi:hypothetical protein
MQEIRRFKASAVSRRFSITAGFCRTCVIDGILEHSPAGHVRRPTVPAESPAPGFTHLQFEALLTATRQSGNPCDFALVAMLGLLGLRIFEATGASRCRLPSGGPSTGPSATAPAGRSSATSAVAGWTATPPPAACGAWLSALA